MKTPTHAVAVHPMDGVTTDWLDRLPRGYQESYRRAQRDPELLSTKEEIALYHARIAELLQQLDGAGALHRYKQLADVLEKMKIGYAAGGDLGPLIGMLEGVVTANDSERLVWAELKDFIESKSKVASRESVRQLTLKQMVPAERVMALIVSMIEIFMTHEPDQEKRIAVARDIEKKIINRDAALGERVPKSSIPHSHVLPGAE